MHQYDTVTSAISGLRERGFTEDFNLQENCLICNAQKFNPDEFAIKEVYRFEGDSDPGDEAVVYGIESNNGMKGVLVNSYGYQSETMSDKIAKKLRMETF
ncbi:MAG: phosphoribosylpyrophosphate synthetase [Bacteroidota bacterium]|nr:phosphoribosylpyrophosphate synthetase [Bacteroidota bacterium]